MRKVYCLLFLSFFIVAPFLQPTTGAQTGAPEIRRIKPVRAAAGSRVVIKGRNFSADPQQNIVLFGDVQATISKAKPRKLVVTVPEELTPGRFPVTVTVGGQSSNVSEIEIFIPVTPFAGRFEGQTSRGHRFVFTVRHNQRTVTQLRTSFNCSGGTCDAGATVNSNKFVEIENGRFVLDLSSPNVTARIEGFFVNPVRAEGTAEFSISGPCTCSTGRLNWSAQLQ